MHSVSTRRRWFGDALIPVVAVLGLAGCASTPGSESDRQALLERATAYWDAVKANDLPKAWTYEAASRTGAATLEGYLKRGGIVFDVAQVLDVAEIDADAAKVRVLQRFSIPMMRVHNMEVRIDDPWRRMDGVWFHAPVANPLFQRAPGADAPK